MQRNASGSKHSGRQESETAAASELLRKGGSAKGRLPSNASCGGRSPRDQADAAELSSAVEQRGFGAGSGGGTLDVTLVPSEHETRVTVCAARHEHHLYFGLKGNVVIRSCGFWTDTG